MELQSGSGDGDVGSLDRYLSRVGRHLMGLSTERRQDVLMELRSNLLARAEAEGTSVSALVGKMESPKATARSFVRLYGYGTGSKALTALGAAALAFLTAPFAPVESAVLGAAWLANASLVGLILLLVLVGVRMGRGVALAAGVAAAGSRFAALGIGLRVGTPELATEPVALLTFVATTVVLAFAGVLAAPTASQN